MNRLAATLAALVATSGVALAAPAAPASAADALVKTLFHQLHLTTLECPKGLGDAVCGRASTTNLKFLQEAWDVFLNGEAKKAKLTYRPLRPWQAKAQGATRPFQIGTGLYVVLIHPDKAGSFFAVLAAKR